LKSFNDIRGSLYKGKIGETDALDLNAHGFLADVFMQLVRKKCKEGRSLDGRNARMTINGSVSSFKC
jgi:hypothetical protein